MAKTRPIFLIDEHGFSLPDVLGIDVNHRLAIGATSQVNSTDFTRMIIEVTPTADCVIALGDDTVVAKSGEDYFIPAYSSVTLNARENTRIATQAYNSGETGTLCIAELS